MTVPNLDDGDTITETWVAAVTDQLNELPTKVQSGETTLAFTAGLGTLTFPEAFGAAPVVVANAYYTAGTSEFVVSITARTATTVTFAAYRSGTAWTTNLTVSWIAHGVPA